MFWLLVLLLVLCPVLSLRGDYLYEKRLNPSLTFSRYLQEGNRSRGVYGGRYNGPRW